MILSRPLPTGTYSLRSALSVEEFENRLVPEITKGFRAPFSPRFPWNGVEIRGYLNTGEFRLECGSYPWKFEGTISTTPQGSIMNGTLRPSKELRFMLYSFAVICAGFLLGGIGSLVSTLKILPGLPMVLGSIAAFIFWTQLLKVYWILSLRSSQRMNRWLQCLVESTDFEFELVK